MTEGSSAGSDTMSLQPDAPDEPAEDMDLSDAPKAPPWAGADEDREQRGDDSGDTGRGNAR